MRCVACNEYIPEGLAITDCPSCSASIANQGNEAGDICTIRDKIALQSKDEILQIIYVNAQDYRPEAIAIAKQELRRRDIPLLSADELAEFCKSRGIESPSQRLDKTQSTDLPIKWFLFYTYFRLPVGVLLSMLEIVFMGERIFTVLTAFHLLLISAVFWGLHRRKLWGWRLNWVLLTFGALIFPLESSSGFPYFIPLAMIVVIWVIPNIIYFEKRRYVFH